MEWWVFFEFKFGWQWISEDLFNLLTIFSLLFNEKFRKNDFSKNVVQLVMGIVFLIEPNNKNENKDNFAMLFLFFFFIYFKVENIRRVELHQCECCPSVAYRFLTSVRLGDLQSERSLIKLRPLYIYIQLAGRPNKKK